MPPLSISLQDGFQDDLVILRIDGHEVLRQEHVSTKLLLGYAETLVLEVAVGQHQVEILLPQKNLRATIPLHLTAAIYIGVSVAAGKIDYLVSSTPFGFM